jgi:eukaryotic-like serine/threonine-protein kinase
VSTSNPAIIGRYKVTERLGQGGMGSLYLAHDPVIDRMLAIKVLREGVDNEELRARFAREARAAGRLSHPHIVTIFDVGEFENQPFIAMEYVRGETLEALIRRRVRMPLDHKIKLMEELCDGLAYAHRTGLVHRDIKPANLIVTAEGTLKILDFGIVRLAESGMTQTGMLVGTLPYMSPEQIGGKQVDHRSDIFAVGDVVYELLTHRQAFPGSVKDGIFERILRGEPPPLGELCPDLPEDLPPIVSRALSKDPEARYQDLTTMRADLARVRQRLHQLRGGAGPARSEDATVVAGRGRRGQGTPAGQFTPPSGTARESVTRRRAALIQEHLRAAEHALEAGDPEKAMAEAEGAALLDPYDERAQQLVDRATAAIEERQVQRLLDEARDHLSRGDPTLAAGLVEQALASRPDSADALAVQRAIEDLRRELELARERAQIVRRAIEGSRAALEIEAFDIAIRSADEALVRQPDHPEALELKREATTRRDERRRIEEHERAAEAAVAEARDAFQAKRYDEALALLDRFAPPHAIVSEALDSLRRELEEIRRREAEARRQKLAALTAAARQAADSGRYDEALGLAARIRELDPESDSAAELVRDIGRRKAAAAEAARRAALAAEAVRRAREAFEHKGLAAAAREIEQALEHDPAHADALALRPLVEERLQAAASHRLAASSALTAKDPATAQAELDNARGIEPETPDLVTLESALAALRQRLEEDERQRLERERQERERQEAERRAREEREEAERREHERRVEAERRALEERERAERLAREQREEAERLARKQKEEADQLARERKEEAERLAREQKEEAERLARKRKEEAERQARERSIDKAISKARRKSPPAALALLRPALEEDPTRQDVAALIREYEAAEAAALTADVGEQRRRPGLQVSPVHAAAAAGVVLALAVGGWWLTGGGGDAGPATIPAPATQPEASAGGPANPPPATRDIPATPSESRAETPQPAAAPETKPPAATEPMAADPAADAAIEKELAPIRTRARRELQSGEHTSALSTVERGLKVKGNDADLRRVLSTLLQTAKTQATTARNEASGAGAPRFAGATFDRGVQQERAAEQHQGGGRTEQAVRSLWAARDAFSQAAGEARTAAAEEERRQLAAAQEAERKRSEAAAAEKAKTPASAPAGSGSTSAPATPTTKPSTPPPPTEPPLVTGRSTPVVDPRPAIMQTLRAYEAGWNSGSVDDVRKIWVLSTDQVRSLRDAFAAGQYSIAIKNETIVPSPDGRRATVTCVVSGKMKSRGGGGDKPINSETVFTLESRGSGWIILERKVR